MEKDLEKVVIDNFISMLNLIVDREKKLKDAVSKTKGQSLYKSIIFLSNNTQKQIIDYFILFNVFFDFFKTQFFILVMHN